jgi:E3 ubiquitin-protein ligase ATL10/75/76/77/78
MRQDNSYFSRSFNSNVVVVMAVLLFALVVAAFINTVARCIMRRRRPLQPEDHNNPDKGLDKSVIEALPVVTYGADSLKSFLDPAGGTECVVCLSEFAPGEKIRLLPDCHHGFHLACIDTWLLTHTTCPVCRRSVLPASPCARPPPASAAPASEAHVSPASISRSNRPAQPLPSPPTLARAPAPAPEPSARSGRSSLPKLW